MKKKVFHFLSIILSSLILLFAAKSYPPLKNTLAAEKNGWKSYRGKVQNILDTSVEYYENGN